jgi:hypothetical protein
MNNAVKRLSSRIRENSGVGGRKSHDFRYKSFQTVAVGSRSATVTKVTRSLVLTEV